MLFPAGSGVSSAPSPLLPSFHGCGFVPLHLLFPLFALEIRGEGVQPLSLCCSCCCWRVGWRSAARERPCPYPSLPYPLGILRPRCETLGSWVGQGKCKLRGVGFSLRAPRKECAKDVGAPLRRKPALRRPQSRWLLANLETVTKPCSVGEPAAVPFLRVSGAGR